ncbi:MAG TPA: FixH family protein [Ktedonobacterales bacterium]
MGATREDVETAHCAEHKRLPARSSFAARQRVLALSIALAVVVVLSVGWLADSFATSSGATTSSVLSRQMGLSMVSLTASPSPLRAGRPEGVIVRVTDVSGAPVVGARVQCAWSMPAMDMGLSTVSATATGRPGDYQCPSETLDAGAWTLALSVTLPTGETDHVRFQLVVA